MVKNIVGTSDFSSAYTYTKYHLLVWYVKLKSTSLLMPVRPLLSCCEFVLPLLLSRVYWNFTEWPPLPPAPTTAHLEPLKLSEWGAPEAPAEPPSPSLPLLSWRSWVVGLESTSISWTGVTVLCELMDHNVSSIKCNHPFEIKSEII